MSQSHCEFLRIFGWDDFFAGHWNSVPRDDLIPARVTSQERGLFHLQYGPELVVLANISGKIRNEALAVDDLPAVGDWVACRINSNERATIEAVLPRKTCMRRKQVGEQVAAQVIASNIDYLFVTTSMNDDLNPRRVERYLTLAWDCGSTPVLVLTKSDLMENAESLVSELQAQFPTVEIFGISSHVVESMQPLAKFFPQGKTTAIVGSSGVGKSTLINYLIDDQRMKTQDIRSHDGKGRHTTTSRHMFVSRWGGLVIDTPGMRELQLLDNEEGLSRSFEDIETLALSCRFRDCKHGTEPGCAIQKALVDGQLSSERWLSYGKLLGEIRHYQRKTDKAVASDDKRKWKKLKKR